MSDSSVTFSSGATGPPDLRLLHYNDVYHIEGGSRDPVGGAARFVSLVSHYRSAPEFAGQPELLTFFSGDAFNPSLESSVTKGRHMVPILNEIGTNVACLGNHDLDFGVEQFGHLKDLCKFPWLCANVEDPALGQGVSIGGVSKTVMLESSTGVKIGVIGLVEKEWLDTISSLPPGLVYINAAEAALKWVPQLREQGAEIVIAVSHMREPNDVRLATEIPEGTIDIVLGGHDHHYSHQIVNGCHVIRSGCDFRQLSYIEARRKSVDGSIPGWNFDIIRRDTFKSTPEDEKTAQLVDKLTAGLKAKLEKPIGYTAVPLDGRFTTIRCKESNLGNFTCDLLRFYYNTECALMAGGTMRGDQIYPPGLIKLRDIVECFPFEDPVLVIRVSGASIVKALENGVSKLPALEGRFPHVSGIVFTFDSTRPAGSRVLSCKIGTEDVVPDRKYTLATRSYMHNGKDGFEALSAEAGAEVVVDEENGVIISSILRQYFLALKVVGRWSHGHFYRQFFKALKTDQKAKGDLNQSEAAARHEELDDDDEGSGSESEIDGYENERHDSREKMTTNFIKKMGSKWARLAGVQTGDAHNVDWTSAISPRIEGRIIEVKQE